MSEIIFIHRCCSNGIRQWSQFIQQIPHDVIKGTHFKFFDFVKASEAKMDVKLGINLEELKDVSYIIANGEMIKMSNHADYPDCVISRSKVE